LQRSVESELKANNFLKEGEQHGDLQVGLDNGDGLSVSVIAVRTRLGISEL
jgi:hypothetical protein